MKSTGQPVNLAKCLGNAEEDEELIEVLLEMSAISKEPSSEAENEKEDDTILHNKFQQRSLSFLKEDNDVL